jgi:alanyl-tRNA synthetase
MNTHSIRKKYLNFFKDKGHRVIPSSSLIPENDPTTLFTGSGMQPMVPYLLGEKHPQGSRIVDSQRCFRAQDIEKVGDNRHTTFFEMLGNWSFGDYFKEEQIRWMFEFLTSEIGLDPNRIYITCFSGKDDINIPKDEESAQLWQKLFKDAGAEAEIVDDENPDISKGGRIFYYDETKNWWSRAGVTGNMPVGEPGGPDVEMFWDFGEKHKLHENSSFKDQVCHINCDCGRFFEIGNNVFMEYVKTDNGFEPLPQKNVDFGGGLERIAAAEQDVPDIFQIDLFKELLDGINEQYGRNYKTENKEIKRTMRIVVDHLRASVFMIADGVVPSNTGAGSILRRLLRRAIFKAYELAIGFSNLYPLTKVVINQYKEVYPQLDELSSTIHKIMEDEEIKFMKTIENGSRELHRMERSGEIKAVKNDKLDVFNKVDAKKAFYLNQSFGFPFELIQEELAKKGLIVVEEEFEQERIKHQDLSRAGSEQKFKGGLADHSEMTTKYHTATHLLHKALKTILGDHVEQKGSNITAERLRFDFSHPEKMTPEQKQEVEDIINEAIEKDYKVSWEEVTPEEADASGALGYFKEKYAQLNKVKVYTVGDKDTGEFSREICGGPHVEQTGTLGHFKIKKEESVSAGVRRIKAILE